jgi:ABC-type glycerol-3-phosphate transport system permease component
MAGTVTATLPTLVIFLLGQRWFIQSVAQTGIKG